MRRSVKIIFLVMLSLVAVSVSAWYLFRGILLDKKITSWKNKIKKDYGLQLIVDEPRWTGFSTIQIKSVELLNDHRELVFEAKDIQLLPSFKNLYASSSQLSQIRIKECKLKLQNHPRKKNQIISAVSHPSETLFNFVSKLGKIAENIRVESFLLIKPKTENNDSLTEQLRFILSTQLNCKNEVDIYVKGDGKEIEIYNPELNQSPLLFPQLQFEIFARIGKETIWVSPTSFFKDKDFSLTIFGTWDRNTNSIKCGISLPEQEAGQAIASLPAGSFTEIKKLGINGLVSMGVFFTWNFSDPGSLRIRTSFNTGIFQMKNSLFLDSLNSDFIFSPDNSTRKIRMGMRSASWASLDKIPDQLKWAVIFSEDPGFYENQGLDTGFFRKAAIQNLEQGKFYRGGSTLPMQLIRNLFLSKNKNLARKAEEILFVWINNKTQIVSRERILELYLNLAEWGPGIYGVKEAAQFYFHKSLNRLTADECIFMAGLLPNPRMYKTQFTSEGHLQAFVEDYFAGMKLKMFDKNLIEEKELDKSPEVRLAFPISEKSKFQSAEAF